MTRQPQLTLESIDHLAAYLRETPNSKSRQVIAIAGPPGGGKSTASVALQEQLEKAAVLQADGFHYDNALLDQLGLRHRKGAPNTFDCAGLKLILERIRTGEPGVVVPVFDRAIDVSRGGAAMVSNDARFIIVEGNYLASSESPWVDLRPCFDLIVYLEVPLSELVRRLHCRWEEHGWSREKAERWIETNDLPNIKYTQDTRSGVDILIGSAA